MPAGKRSTGMKLTGIAWRLCLAATVLAPPAAAQSRPDLLRKLRQDVADRGLLVWSPAALPDWSAFSGQPRLGTATAAETSSGVTYLIHCRGDTLSWAVLATFSPAQSWVRPDIVKDPETGPVSLRHEHTHFHISELLARWVRKGFAELRRPCPGGDERIHAVFQRLAADGAALQAQYDNETRHGLRRGAERRWQVEILDRLDQLRQYASPGSSSAAEPGPPSGP